MCENVIKPIFEKKNRAQSEALHLYKIRMHLKIKPVSRARGRLFPASMRISHPI